ncbi:Putative adhesin [Haloechinothrix alba]|uniref:Putative adhesin n=1 Tax=Haloechinothrix alba TaxID=664784 RepID=A0A238YWJ5_9PSEU|nr:DUF4097 family beta strand repeat-containing protein [Haloechinothrix alba]SNR75004.1 Putative adhesin [Haloechinothrix alba]
MNDSGATARASTTAHRRWRAVWFTAGGLLTVAALLLGSLGVVSAWAVVERPFTETETSSETYSRAAAHLDLEIERGQAHVTGNDADRVEVQRELTWSNSRPTVDETWVGDTLRVRTECTNSFPRWIAEACSIGYSARLPRAAAADIRATTGSIDVRALDGELTLTSMTGPITVDDTAGSLTARTNTGDITGSNLGSAEVDTKVSTGDTELRFAEEPRRVSAVATTGSVTIEVPRGVDPYQVDVHTSTGDQRVDIAQDPRAARFIDVRTTTGDVHVRYSS